MGLEETPPELIEDLRRLVFLAYQDTTEAMDQFIDAQLNLDLQIKISERRPETLEEPVEFATKLEPFLAAVHQEIEVLRKMEADHCEPCKYSSMSDMYDERGDSNLVHDLIKFIRKNY